MNKTAIKNFAIWARNKLIADICYRAGLMGITEKGIADPLPQSTLDAQFYDIGAAEPYLVAGEAIKQRRQLVSVIREKEVDTDYATAYQYIMEEVAYTWFNRLIAVRFMEVNDYLTSHLRVLSSESGKVEPDLVTTPFDADLPFTAEEEAQIIQWKQDNKLDELFRFLFIKQCNALNEILPGLFEKTTDYTEVLLNLSVVDQEGVVYKLTHDIPEKDFNIEQGGQVEIIGWLYQYYNTEPKAAAFAKNGKITKEEIPAVTQLFTPDWIVRYMVENSLGRLWVEGHPDSDLRKNWKYYLDEAPQEPEVQTKLATIRKEYATLKPEDLTLIDPCMGSGHILVYAFDVLMQIYESVGYSQRDAAKSILEHNLYGLDIDDRAYQLAYFAVMMKARQYNRRILNGENTCHVHAIQESNSINRAHLKFFGAGLSDLEKNTAKMQMEGLLDILTDAKEYGSILNVPEYNWALLRRFVDGIDMEGQVSFDDTGVEKTAKELKKLIDLGETMARKYEISITNPPYLQSSSMDEKLSSYVDEHYENSNNDLYAVFVKRCTEFLKNQGIQAMITMHSWMTAGSYESFRRELYQRNLINMVHLGKRAFEEISGDIVQTVAWAQRRSHISEYKSVFVKLIDFLSESGKEKEFFDSKNVYVANSDSFADIPGRPFSYWVCSSALKLYKGARYLSDEMTFRRGISTGANDVFLRLWHEVDVRKTCFAKKIPKKWVAYNKGGSFRKWYGNRDHVVLWENDGKKMKEYKGSAVRNTAVQLMPCLSYSSVATGKPSFRVYDGFLNDQAGNFLTLNVASKEDGKWLLGLLNSTVAAYLLKVKNTTQNITADALNAVPIVTSQDKHSKIEDDVNSCLTLAKEDWDAFEVSWDFKTHPLVKLKMTGANPWGDNNGAAIKLSSVYKAWEITCDGYFEKLKANEEELNRIFIDIYGLRDELTPEVEDKDVTVRKADLQRDIKSLLSYAVGCMFGRYSLDVPGLVLAGQPFEEKFVHAGNAVTGTGVLGAPGLLRAPGALYLRTEDGVKQCTFAPDVDNVIPITDEEYLEDDIVARLCDWLKVVYGADTLEANLDYIAKALGNKGSTSREVIRNYFVNDFFKDHCQTYSVTGSGKRPIYWLFDSGKQNGFKALVYLHRYTPDTIGTLRVDYLHKMQRVYESEINRMQDMMDHTTNAREAAAASKRKDKLTKQLKECRDYDEKISHLALSRIALDLDDGVKVNYRKLQTAADGKFYEVLADSKNIMAKEKK